MRRLVKAINKWQERTFPGQGVLSKFRHLEREIRELEEVVMEAIHSGADERTEEELADCFFLLVGIAAKLDINFEKAVRKKFKINKQRVWGSKDDQGIYKQI